jgi:hypothetical protein
VGSRQAQLASELRRLRAGLGDNRNVTWEADQALRRLRGNLLRARRAGVRLDGAEALLAAALEGVAAAERSRQASSAAVARWLALHDAAGGGGAAPVGGGWTAGRQRDAEQLIALAVAPVGSVQAADLLIELLGESGVPMLAPGAAGIAPLVRFLAGEIAERGFDEVIRGAALRTAGTPAPAGHRDRRPSAAVIAAEIAASAVLTAAGAPWWVVAPAAGATNVVGWVLSDRGRA